MAKVRLTLHPAIAAITKIEKKLRSIRKKVSNAEQKKIDLELETLQKAAIALKIHCRAFVQTFDVKN